MTRASSTEPVKTRVARFVAAAAAAKRMFQDAKVLSQTEDRRSGDGKGTADPAPVSTGGPDWLKFVPAEVRGIVQSHLPAGLPDVLGFEAGGPFGLPSSPATAPSEQPAGARFLSGQFSNQAGSRPYRLYVPSGYDGAPVPLIVMLHGCSQSPEDFAVGTGMNDVAEEQTCLVLYPGQTKGAHAQKCWKWFSVEDQNRDQGEPSLIAGMTRQVMRDYAIDPARVFVAGMSAGGAAAAIMSETYPDLYAAVGVHSGLACGAAHDLASALAAMKRGSGSSTAGSSKSGRRLVPTIVFHGEHDKTVSARNGDDVVMQAIGGASLRAEVSSGRAPEGHAFSRTIHSDASGQPMIEQWVIHGAGHAWSGGRAAGSFTDPHGPDATREMIRFFQAHPMGTP